MKKLNYTGSSKLKSRIAYLLNRKAPLPLDGNDDPDWGTNGQVLSTDGNGNTAWVNQGGGGSGGHTIENTSGAELPQEENLQFVGVYIEDDSDHDRTKVNIVRQMTKAAMEALSSAEKEGFIDTTDEDDDYIPIAAEDVKYGNTDVESALDDIYSQISGGSRTVTTLVNESVSIAANSGYKDYSALTATALSAYDEIHFLVSYGNVYINGMATKAQMAAVTAKTSPANGRLHFYGGNVISSGSETINYYFRIRADASGLRITNGSISNTIDSLLIQGIKYNY